MKCGCVLLYNQTGVSGVVVRIVEHLDKTQKRLLWLSADLFAFVLATIGAYLFFYAVVEMTIINYVIYTLIAFIIYLVISSLAQLDKRINRYSGITELISLFVVYYFSSVISGLLSLIILDQFSFRFTILAGMITSLIGVSFRIIWQNLYLSKYKNNNQTDDKRRVVVIGAGDGGSVFMTSYRRNPRQVEVVTILDKDPTKVGKIIGGIKVMGDQTLLPMLAKEQNVQEVIIAIPSLEPSEYEEILKIANDSGLDVYKMPPVEDVIQGVHRPAQDMEKINIGDLLGRKEVQLDESRLRTELEGKTILITGAGGSIGSEISRQVSQYNPRRIILLGHGENSIYLIHRELISKHIEVDYVPIIADVQDYERLLEVFHTEKPDIVYHAAAHKHVPLMEGNPAEALKNNVIGTYNVARAVDQSGVPKMVMISTDKAVRPPNVMGATKRMAELIVTGMDQVSESTFSAVRFGNVLGSRGSVIPVFESQIKSGGPVTVTDFRMTRYFMTIPEASRLVIFAGLQAAGGEVFILDMGNPVKILDLAKKMILLSGHTESEIQIVETGIRPGEKLYEELLTSTEQIENQIDDKIFIGKVATVSLAEIDQFLEELKQYSGNELKDKIIQFANDSAN